jgi:hypothetical protein
MFRNSFHTPIDDQTAQSGRVVTSASIRPSSSGVFLKRQNQGRLLPVALSFVRAGDEVDISLALQILN